MNADFKFDENGDMIIEEFFELLKREKERERNSPPFYTEAYRRKDGHADYLYDLIPDYNLDSIPLSFHFGFDYKTGTLKYLKLLPEDKKESDRLNDYSKILMIENPEYLIREAVKCGLEKEIPADDFQKLQFMSTTLSKYVFDELHYANIFQVLANMTRLFYDSTVNTDNATYIKENPISVQRFLDYNKIHGRDRNSFYEFISRSSTPPGHDSSSCISVSPSNCKTRFYIPRKNGSLFIYTSKKLFFVTLYHPQEYISYAPEEYRFLNNTVFLHDPGIMEVPRLMKMLRGKDIELYQYCSDDKKESVVFRGSLIPVEAVKASRKITAIEFKIEK